MTNRREEGTLIRQRTGGPALYSLAVAPADPAKAVVGVLHGYADYSARYTHVLDAWAERGIASVAIDMRGHGRAEGPRGFCHRFGEYLDDVAELVHRLDAWAPGLPRFLFGHSFGGLVATSAAIEHPGWWRALVLSGPFFGLAMSPPPLKLLAGRIASRMAPGLRQPSGLRGKDVTHDAARARAYDSDPLVFKDVTARWFTETRSAQERAIERAPSLKMPLYVVMGEADAIARVASARAFFDAAGSADKTWDLRPGLFHEVLNESEWRPIADRIADFILAH
jgi:alpha-beta hydrolase superfamily lysophospholipase